MNTIKKLIILFSLVVVLAAGFAVSSPVHAATLADEIASLRAQIATLQLKLQAMLGIQSNPGPTWCYAFDRNLKFGDGGAAVAALQTALSKQGFYASNNSSATFDERLASAVVAFQERYAATILVPNGLAHGTGYVGVSTRAKLNALYGCNVKVNGDLVINNVSGPATIGVNQTGTWTINASDPDDNTLAYSINWGDQVESPALMGASPIRVFSQIATFTHVYSALGNYTVTVKVMDNEGNSATTTSNVSVVAQGNIPPVAIDQSVSVKENASANITLTGTDTENSVLVYTVVSTSVNGTLSGSAPNLVYTPNTNFTGSDSFTFKVNDGNQDSNVATVSVMVNATTSGNLPVISGVSGPTSLGVNQTGTWTISASTNGGGPLNYSVTWGDEGTMNTAASGQTMTSGQPVTFTHAYSVAANYTITFRVSDTSGNTATGTITVIVQSSGTRQITLQSGEREGPLLVQNIYSNYITGLRFMAFPVQDMQGQPITLYVGESVSNGCTVTLTLNSISGNTATFTEVSDYTRICPI